MEAIRNLLSKGLIACILIYRWFISPFLGQNCRFYPSCSEYALEAIKTYPIHTALIWILKRIGRCHPWCAGGFDPLPNNSRLNKE